jgi:hypothetical protein
MTAETLCYIKTDVPSANMCKNDEGCAQFNSVNEQNIDNVWKVSGNSFLITFLSLDRVKNKDIKS